MKNETQKNGRAGDKLDELVSIFAIYDDNNSMFSVKGIFTSYKKAFDNLPDNGHAIREYPLNELRNGRECMNETEEMEDIGMKCLNNRCACEADGECCQSPIGCECHIPADGVYDSSQGNGCVSVPVKVSIDDGYVEYTYDFDIGATHSIHTILGMICASLGVSTPPKGEMRYKHE